MTYKQGCTLIPAPANVNRTLKVDSWYKYSKVATIMQETENAELLKLLYASNKQGENDKTEKGSHLW